MSDHDDHGNGEHRPPATPQEIWSILRQVSESQRETDRRMQETDRRLQETDRLLTRQAQEAAQRAREIDRSMQETDRRLQETDRLLTRQAQEAAQRARDADRRFRGLDDLFNGQWGKLMEALVEGDLIELLKGRGIEVEHTLTNVRHRGERSWEFDIIAVNGAEVVVVEVKTTLKVRQVDHFLGRMQEFTDLMPRYRESTVYGAVAYLKADEAADRYAERQGLYVIRATGSSASITNPRDFRPRTFSA